MLYPNFYENDLVLPETSGTLTPSRHATDAHFDGVSTSGNFLPRIQLFGSNSDAVKEGLIGQGRYGFVKSKENIFDLGPTFDGIVLAWRPKAMQITEAGIITVYDPTSVEFKRISELSQDRALQAMYGPEFLIWIPDDVGYGTFFMSSKTARREAPNVKALMNKRATFTCELIKTPKYKWHGPKVSACSRPFDGPSAEGFEDQVNRFNTPPESEMEKDTDGERSR